MRGDTAHPQKYRCYRNRAIKIKSLAARISLMNQRRISMIINLKSKLGLLCVFSFLLWKPGLLSASPSANQQPSCSTPEYKQFDFWVGDWDAFEAGSTAPSARVQVDRLLDGCVLREQYAGADGHQGQSLSIYDGSRKVWHQSWFTNRGELLVIEGTFQSGEIILSGADRTADGKERRVRGIWKPEGDGLRETAVTSTDGGRTWKPWFDLVFRPHR
jgi:hypothetical protein